MRGCRCGPEDEAAARSILEARTDAPESMESVTAAEIAAEKLDATGR